MLSHCRRCFCLIINIMMSVKRSWRAHQNNHKRGERTLICGKLQSTISGVNGSKEMSKRGMSEWTNLLIIIASAFIINCVIFVYAFNWIKLNVHKLTVTHFCALIFYLLGTGCWNALFNKCCLMIINLLNIITSLDIHKYLFFSLILFVQMNLKN